ncbi:MAG: hypothetical protein ACYTDU_10225 [Planctomycetota bacterium]|jgi:hypothetical protein
MGLGAEMLGHFLEAFRGFPDRRGASRAQSRAAVESVLAAARQTQAYLGAVRDRPGPSDRATELELIDLWHDAALHLERVDAELSQICLTKAQFWARPKDWSHEEFDAVLHTAQEVCDEAHQRLEESG